MEEKIADMLYTGICCESCALFTFDVPQENREAFRFYREGVHGWCQGGPGHPAHIEHKESIRCVWFVAK
jgi:hypothetical protein